MRRHSDRHLSAVLRHGLFLSFVITAVFLFSFASADVVQSGTVGSLTWELDENNVLSITGEGEMNESLDDNSLRQNITKVHYGPGVSYIQPGLYSYCYELTAFEVDEANPNYKSVDGILYTKDGTVLVECPTAKTGDLVIPDGVVTISGRAFVGNHLTSVVLPDTLETIGAEAFWNSEYLTEITLPRSYAEFEASAFNRCQRMTAFHVDAQNESFAAADGILYTKDLQKLLRAPGGTSGTLTVPNHVTIIGPNAFEADESLTEVVLQEGVQTIGSNAFTYSGVQKVTLPISLTTIDRGAFENADQLKEVQYLGTKAQCESISIGESNGSLNFLAVHCSDGDVEAAPITGSISENESDSITYTLTPDGNLTVTGAGEWKYWAFMNNKTIVHAILEDGVSEIGWGGFFWCTSLQDIVLPATLKDIKFEAFYSCRSLRSITIPSSVEHIGNEVFDGCDQLTEISFAGTMAEWQALINGTSNTKIAECTIRCSDGNINDHGSGTKTKLPAPVFEYVNNTDTIGRSFPCKIVFGEDTPWPFADVTYINADGSKEYVYTILDGWDWSTDYENDGHGAITATVPGYVFQKPGSYLITAGARANAPGESASEEFEDSETSEYTFTLEDAELPTLTFELSAEEIQYGESLTVSVSPSEADEWVMGYAVYSLSSDEEVEGTGTGHADSVSGTYTGNKVGRYEYRVYGCINGVWSKEGIFSFRVLPLYYADPPRLTYQEKEISGTLSLTPSDPLVFVASAEHASILFWELSEFNSSTWLDYGYEYAETMTFDLSELITENGTYELKVSAQWQDGWGCTGSDVITVILTIQDKETSGTIGDNVHWSLETDGVLRISGEGNIESPASGNYPWLALKDQILSVDIEDGITSIGSSAFSSCGNLKSLTIPGSITSIGDKIVDGCDQLSSIYYEGNKAAWKALVQGTDNTKIASSLINCYDGSVYPEGMTQIPAPVISSVVSGGTIGRDLTCTIDFGEYTEWSHASVYYVDENGNEEYAAKIVDEWADGVFTETVPGYAFQKPGTYEIRAYALTHRPWYPANEEVKDSETTVYEFTLADAELQTLTFELSSDRIKYGESVTVTSTPSEADQWIVGWTLKHFYTDEVLEGTGHYKKDSISGTYSGDKVGRHEYRVYGCFDGLWSKEGIISFLVLPTGYVDPPTVTYQGTKIRSALTVLPSDPLVFSASAEHCKYLWWDISKINSSSSSTWLGSDSVQAGTMTFDISEFITENGTYELKVGADWEDGWGCQGGDYRTITLTVQDSRPEGTLGDHIHWALDGNGTLTISGEGAMPDLENPYEGPAWLACKDQITRVIVSDGITSIGGNAFFSCFNLIEAVIPDSVTSLGNGAFYLCSSLPSIQLPKVMSSIGRSAFEGCSSLTEFTVPSGITLLDDYFLYDCHELLRVSIPDSVTRINPLAFEMCDKLADVYYGGTEAQWNAIDFQGTDHFPNAEIHFSGMPSFTNVLTLPDSLVSIESEAFAGLTSVDAVRIPAGVTQIADNAFDGTDLVIIAPDSSYAAQWAEEHGIEHIQDAQTAP